MMIQNQKQKRRRRNIVLYYTLTIKKIVYYNTYNNVNLLEFVYILHRNVLFTADSFQWHTTFNFSMNLHFILFVTTL